MLCSKKDRCLIKAFTYDFQIFFFTFVGSVNLSVCVCMSISLYPTDHHPPKYLSNVHLSVSPPAYWRLLKSLARWLQPSLIGFCTSILYHSQMNPWSGFKTFQLFLNTLSVKTKHLVGSAPSSPYSLSSFMLYPVPYCPVFQPHWPLFHFHIPSHTGPFPILYLVRLYAIFRSQFTSSGSPSLPDIPMYVKFPYYKVSWHRIHYIDECIT